MADFFFFSTPLLLAGNSGRLTLERHNSRKSSATQLVTVCAVFTCVQTKVYGCLCLGFLTYAHVLMHAIARGSCTHTVRESALKVDSGREKENKKKRKIHAAPGTRTRVNIASGFFSRTLYQLSYPRSISVTSSSGQNL